MVPVHQVQTFKLHYDTVHIQVILHNYEIQALDILVCFFWHCFPFDCSIHIFINYRTVTWHISSSFPKDKGPDENLWTFK